MIHKTMTYSFYILFFFTPLFFSPLTSELFEFNKMMLVYLLATVITGTWLIRMIQEKTFLLKRTPLDIPLALFLLSQILSTAFSIDHHTSLWGYYSRSNGGLFSIISYTLLYYALVSNFTFKEALKFLKAALLGSLVVSLYAIPEHFGLSPSCVILQRSFTADCWVQDVQARVFATLGQPNWLAAYLGMLIFPAIYFALTAKTKLLTIIYSLLTVIYYLAFTFTYSRGATIGLVVGVAVGLLMLTINFFRKEAKKERAEKIKTLFYWVASLIFLGLLSLPLIQGTPLILYLDGALSSILYYLNYLLPIFSNARVITPFLILVALYLLFNWIVLKRYLNKFHQDAKKIFLGLTIFGLLLIVSVSYGSALTANFALIKEAAAPARPGITQNTSVGTQLENGGTESGQIRLIVWKGALEIFKHYPLFGSGVETFAYSYYQFRPIEHNLVSEWDFLYNKAHNEYLNYLATTGVVGFVSYMLLIATFVWWSLSRVLNLQLTAVNKLLFLPLSKPKQLEMNQKLLIIIILTADASYLIQDFFGFSVVIVALFFFLFPAFSFLAAEEAKLWTFSKRSMLHSLISNTIYSKAIFISLTCWVIAITTILTLYTLVNHWRADTYYKKGQDYSDTNPGRAFNYLVDAVSLNKGEPLYHAELGSAAATSAMELKSTDATLSAYLKDQAVEETRQALKISPANTSIWRIASLSYYNLSTFDPKYQQTTVETLNQTIKLAPSDPKLYYNKALILELFKRDNEAVMALEQAIKLKPNYQDALFNLGELYQKKGQIDQAKKQFETILKFIPHEPGALNKLQELATASAQEKPR